MIFKAFQNLRGQGEVLGTPYQYALDGDFKKDNLLIYDDNLNAMRYLIQERNYKNKLDLVYIDPPFGTNNVFRLGGTISADKKAQIAYADRFNLDGYLEFLYSRLVLIREMMSENGSLYIHIDMKMGHYVKILCDEIFGRERFVNDITRIKCNPKNFSRKGYGNIKDVILFYVKSDKYIWNEIYEEVSECDLKKRFSRHDEKGFYTTIPLHAPGTTHNGESGQEWNGLKPPLGRHWRCSLKELNRLEKKGLIEWSKNRNPRKKIYMNDHKGKKIQDIWEFKDVQNPQYPTQKNSVMLKRIIQMSSNKDSLVMDCFCGSGGFLKESFFLNRKFIGIDEGIEAIKLNQEWMDTYNANTLYLCDYGVVSAQNCILKA